MKEKDAKVQQNFVIESFSDQNTLNQYSDDTFKIGLWESEKIFSQSILRKMVKY